MKIAIALTTLLSVTSASAYDVGLKLDSESKWKKGVETESTYRSIYAGHQFDEEVGGKLKGIKLKITRVDNLTSGNLEFNEFKVSKKFKIDKRLSVVPSMRFRNDSDGNDLKDNMSIDFNYKI